MAVQPPVIAGVCGTSLNGEPSAESSYAAQLVRSLVTHYGAGQGYLFEPDDSGRLPTREAFPELKISRVHTTAATTAGSGAIEYLMQVARKLERAQPDVLVVSSAWVLPVVFKLADRPRCVIFSGIGPSATPTHDRPALLSAAFASAHGFLDLAIFSDSASINERVGRERAGGPVVEIVHPAFNRAAAAELFVSVNERNGRALHCGTISDGSPLLAEAIRSSPDALSVDHVGAVEASGAIRVQLASGGNVRSVGKGADEAWGAVRRGYSYRVVLADASGDRAKSNAALLEAIADGVPPIVTACAVSREIVTRYGCGILIDEGAGEAALAQALCRGKRLVGTRAYAEMVAGCANAVRREVHWEHGFAKVVKHLPRRFD
jgi:glycosyltransferase involved in cell wall biosynthesis